MIQTVNCLNSSFFACFSHVDSWAEGKAWTLAVVCRKMHFCQPGNAGTPSTLVINGKEQTWTYYFVCMKMEPLEQMVDITAKLFECDRDEMYSYIIRLCSKSTRLQMFLRPFFFYSIIDVVISYIWMFKSVCLSMAVICISQEFQRDVFTAAKSTTHSDCSVNADCQAITPTLLSLSHSHTHTHH